MVQLAKACTRPPNGIIIVRKEKSVLITSRHLQGVAVPGSPGVRTPSQPPQS